MEWHRGLEPLKTWRGASERSPFLIKLKKKETKTQHISQPLCQRGVMEWSFRVVCSGGKYWSDTVGLTNTKRMNKCHILTIIANNTLVYSAGLGVKLYQYHLYF